MGNGQSKQTRAAACDSKYMSISSLTHGQDLCSDTDDSSSPVIKLADRTGTEADQELTISFKKSRRAMQLPTSLGSGLFSSFPDIYITPDVPRHISHLLRLYGGNIRRDFDDTRTICMVAGRRDRMLPTLYLRGSGVFSAEWVEACFVAGTIVPLQGFVIWPWEYTGGRKYVPEELFDFEPMNLELDVEQVECSERTARSPTVEQAQIANHSFLEASRIPPLPQRLVRDHTEKPNNQDNRIQPSQAHAHIEPESSNGKIKPNGLRRKRKSFSKSNHDPETQRRRPFEVYRDPSKANQTGSSQFKESALEEFAALVSAVTPVKEDFASYDSSRHSTKASRPSNHHSSIPQQPLQAPGSSIRLTLTNVGNGLPNETCVYSACPNEAAGRTTTPPGSPPRPKSGAILSDLTDLVPYKGRAMSQESSGSSTSSSSQKSQTAKQSRSYSNIKTRYSSGSSQANSSEQYYSFAPGNHISPSFAPVSSPHSSDFLRGTYSKPNRSASQKGFTHSAATDSQSSGSSDEV